MSIKDSITNQLIAGSCISIDADKYLDKKSENSGLFRKHVLGEFKRAQFWRAGDVRYIYRSFCRSALKMLDIEYAIDGVPIVLCEKEVIDKFYDEKNKQKESINFDNLLKVNNITEKELLSREKALSRVSCICLFFMAISILYFIWNPKFFNFITCLSSLIIAFSLYFKYSFFLWQLRKRSLDKEIASVSKFLSTSWYLECLR